MNIITKSVKLVAPPTPPIPTGRGTFLVIDASVTKYFGISAATLAEGSSSVTVDWGDGQRQIVTGDIAKLVHTYEHPGRYLVSISDDVDSFGIGSSSSPVYESDYAPMILRAVSRGKMTGLFARCFRNASNLAHLDFTETAVSELYSMTFSMCCRLTSLDGLPPTVRSMSRLTFASCTSLVDVSLPGVVDINTAAAGTMPFTGCDALREIHFAAANETAIKSSRGWQADPTLGVTNATILFDL